MRAAVRLHREGLLQAGAIACKLVGNEKLVRADDERAHAHLVPVIELIPRLLEVRGKQRVDDRDTLLDRVPDHIGDRFLHLRMVVVAPMAQGQRQVETGDVSGKPSGQRQCLSCPHG